MKLFVFKEIFNTYTYREIFLNFKNIKMLLFITKYYVFFFQNKEKQKYY